MGSMTQRLTRCQRMRKRADIDPVFRRGLRAGDGRLLLVARRRDDRENGEPSRRGGVSVSKRHGSAVRRNRLKRLCRETWRLSQHDLPDGFDYVLVPRVGVQADLAGLQESLIHLAGRIARRAEKGGSSS